MSKPFTGIAYEPHPVSPERKAELRAQGLQIIDAVFAPADAKRAEAPKSEPAPKSEKPAKPAKAEK
jgi:hypothetical protein